MNFLRALSVLFFLGILFYTIVVIGNYGMSLFEVFSQDILAWNWSGQFNLDFSCYLLLSGLWIAWRTKFSLLGVFLGIVASILGILVFAPYLLVISYSAKGDWRKFFLGDHSI